MNNKLVQGPMRNAHVENDVTSSHLLAVAIIIYSITIESAINQKSNIEM
jgi:hypothetical protein